MALFTKEDMSVDTLSGRTRLSCSSCKLYKNQIDSPKLEAKGSFHREVLIVGEFTSVADDHAGKYFNGGVGKYLLKKLDETGLSKRDISYVNAVRCLPLSKHGKSRTPTNHEIDCCRVHLNKTIEKLQPKLIIALGDVALMSLIGNRWKKDLGSIKKWRGFIIPDKDYNCWIAPMFSPSFVLKSSKSTDSSNVRHDLTFERDLFRINTFIDAELPVFKKVKIHYHYKSSDLKILKDFTTVDLISFDYETTGLKPHKKGHRILIVSIVVNDNEVHVFKLSKNKKKLKPLITLLAKSHIKKAAHNIKFEHNWTKELLGFNIDNWHWDSAIAAHLLDNRSYISNLKFQTYVNFGVVDYASEITPYLESSEKSANSFNKLLSFITRKRANLKKAMKYCGWDSIWQNRLMQVQQAEFEMYQLPF